MNIRRVLFAAISAAALILSISLAACRQFPAAGAAFLAGGLWLLLEARRRPRFPAVFLAFFTGLAALAVLKQASVPWVLAGLTAALAAWDLSRFLGRLKHIRAAETQADPSGSHLRRLFLTLLCGFLLALLPLFIRLPLNFIVLCALAALAVLAFRSAVLRLR